MISPGNLMISMILVDFAFKALFSPGFILKFLLFLSAISNFTLKTISQRKVNLGF